MRIKPMPLWAENETYATGDKVGSPTRVEPTAAIIADGHLPNKPGGAQWENWHKYEAGRRIRALQDLAVTLLTPATLTLEPTKLARLDGQGITIYPSPATDDSVVYAIFDSDLSDQAIALPNDSDSWRTQDVAANRSRSSLIVCGRNTAIDTGGIWCARVGVASGAFQLVETVSGQTFTVCCVDDATGSAYVLSSSKIMKSTDGGVTWADLGDHGQATIARAAAYGDQIIILHQSDASYRYSLDGGVTWQTGTAPNSTDETCRDLRYSPDLGLWIATFSDPNSISVLKAAAPSGPWATHLTVAADSASAASATVLPTGYALPQQSVLIDSDLVQIRYSLDMQFSRAISAPEGSKVRFDGYCLWIGSGTSWYRGALIR